MKTKINILKAKDILIMLMAFAFCSNYTNAKNVIWTGAYSHLWSNSLNWSGVSYGSVPMETDNVFIPNTANQPIVNVDVKISSLIINGGGRGSILTLDGVHSINVNGNVTVIHKGTDKIRTSSSVMTIANGGNLSGSGEMDLSGNGKLYISGNLTIADMKAGEATGSRVVFNGISQTINNGKEYHFNDLDIHSGYTALVQTNLKIDGDLIGGGTLSGENNKIQLAGDMMLVAYKPGKSTFELASGDMGSASVQHLNANTFYILENFDQKTVLSGSTKVLHQLDFEKGNIYLGYDNVNMTNGAKLTRGDAAEVSHVETGSKGYFIIDGTGKVHITGGAIFSGKTKATMLSQNVSCDLDLADIK